MPFYRINGFMVHVKLSGRKRKAPAPCCAVIERDGRRQRCEAPSSFLCDQALVEGGTCDAPLCGEHAHHIGPDRHLCPIHRARAQHGQKEMF